ncbi:MAG: hypothetical protein WCF18_21255, partial [Chthoniobacteraceae bacterium]
YEAPAGQPLSALARCSQPWASVRHWLHDLGTEIDAAVNDGTLPERVGVDHVWLASDGRAVLLDEPWPADQKGSVPVAENSEGLEAAEIRALRQLARPPRKPQPAPDATTPAGVQHFLYAVANPVLDRADLALHAQDFVEKLRQHAFDRLSFLLGTLQSMLAKPATVTRRRRFAAFAYGPGSCAALLLLSLFLIHASNWEGLVDGVELYAAARGEEVRMSHFGKPAASAAMAESAACFVSGHFGKMIRSPKFDRDAQSFGVWEHYRELAHAAVTAQPEVSAARLAQADADLGVDFAKVRTGSLLQMIRAMLWSVVFCSWIGPVNFGFAPVLRALGLAVVDREGRPAGRLRLLWRGLPCLFVVWGGSLQLAAATIVLGLIWIALSPTAGLHDRVAGTRVVPR